MTLKLKVLSGLKWSAAGKLLGQIISWISTIVVIRMLEPSDYGLMSLSIIFTSLCYVLSQMGLGSAIVQSKKSGDLLLQQVFSLVILSNSIIFILLWSNAGGVSEFFDSPDLASIMRVQAFQFLFSMFGVVSYAKLLRAMNYRAIAITDFFSFLLNTLVTLYLAWHGFGVWALVYGGMSGVVSRTVLLNIYSPYINRPTFNFNGFKSAANFGLMTSLDQVLWYVYSNLDRFIIGKFLGPSSLGIYSIALQLASLPLEKVGQIINQIAFPAYSEIQGDHQRVAQYTLRIGNLISMLSFPLFFGISVTAPVFVPLLVGDKWLEAIIPLQLLALLGPLKIINATTQPAISGVGFPSVNVKNLLIACLIMSVSFLIGIRWGILGICYSWLIGFSIWFFIMLKIGAPYLGLSSSRILSPLLSPAIVSVFMYAFVYMIYDYIINFQINLIHQLLILVLSGLTFQVIVYRIFLKERLLNAYGLVRINK